MKATNHATVNVGRHSPHNQKRAFKRVRNRLLPELNVFVGWQEIGEADGPVDEDYHLEKAFSRRWLWRTVRTKTKTPITFRTVFWKVEDVRSIKAMDGIRGVSPNRYIVVVRLVNRVTGEKLSRINTHYVAGAWNSNRNQRAERKRRKGWLKHWELERKVVADEVSLGYNVVCSRDGNKQSMGMVHPNATRAYHHSVDYIDVVPAIGYKAKIKKRKSIGLDIDFHRAGLVKVKFKRVK